MLDAGCAIGFLVEELRARGVDASGIDVSEYALAQVPDALRPYCRLQPITGDLGGPYDLVTCIEVLEHLPEADAWPAVRSLCDAAAYGVLFSSSPSDFAEPTHVNVRPRQYWIGLFARAGFKRSSRFDASVVTRHALYFEPVRPFGRLRVAAASELARLASVGRRASAAARHRGSRLLQERLRR